MNLYGLAPGDMSELVARYGEVPYRAGQLLDGLYRSSATTLDAIGTLPSGFRATLGGDGWEMGTGSVVREVASEDGDTRKALLDLGGTLIETVLMRYAEEGQRRRSTVCVSTQAGCAMGCVFCATGQMGFERNLGVGEVVAQVVHFDRQLRQEGERVTNVVFMGMGEPLANYKATIEAVRILVDPRGVGIGQRHVTVSTVGIVQAIDRLAGEGMQVGLAISLHAPDDGLRRELVPTATRDSVGQLVEAGDRYFAATGRRVSYEYALLAGVNDSEEQGEALGRLLAGRPVHVNLIPVNATMGPYDRPARDTTRRFREAVEREGRVPCTVRIEKGAEIAAACGQLRTDTAGAGPRS